jgi:competence protein ComEA
MSSPATFPPRSDVPVDRRPRATPSGSQPTIPADSAAAWGLSRGDRWFLALMLAVLAGLLAMHARRETIRNAAPVTVVRAPEAAEYVFHLDPNTATWVEWTQLDGIGPTLAKRIVADRQERGPYRTIDDLGRVKGIGAKTLDKMRPHLMFGDAAP